MTLKNPKSIKSYIFHIEERRVRAQSQLNQNKNQSPTLIKLRIRSLGLMMLQTQSARAIPLLHTCHPKHGHSSDRFRSAPLHTSSLLRVIQQSQNLQYTGISSGCTFTKAFLGFLEEKKTPSAFPHVPFITEVSTATKTVPSRIVALRLSLCQSLADLHELFMPLKPMPRRRLLHITKSRFQNKIQSRLLEAKLLYSEPEETPPEIFIPVILES